MAKRGKIKLNSISALEYVLQDCMDELFRMTKILNYAVFPFGSRNKRIYLGKFSTLADQKRNIFTETRFLCL